MSVSQELSIYFEGQSKPLPLDYQKIEIIGDFSGGSNQASLSIERLTLVNEAAFFVIDYVAAGNIYEGLKITLKFSQFDTEDVIMEGFLDLTDEYEEVEPIFRGEDSAVMVRCKVTDLSSRDLFRDKIEGNTYSLLEQRGIFVNNDYQDIDFVIEDDFDPLKLMFLVFMFFSIIDKIALLIQAINKSIADVAAAFSQLPSGPVVALVYSVVLLGLQILYFAFLVSALFDTFFQIITMGISPVYTNKGQSLYSLISKALKSFGYEFESPIEELKDFYYMGSLPFDDSRNLIKDFLPFPALVEKGIPSTGDFGYYVDQMIQIPIEVFNAKTSVVGSTVHLRNVDDPFWKQTSNLTLADTKLPTRRKNTKDLKGTNTLEFEVDFSDKWTTRNRKGTAHEVKTTVKYPRNSNKYDLVKGLNRSKTGVALMNRKDDLNDTEELFFKIANALDKLSELVGGDSDFAGMITDRVGVGKMTTSNTTVPKLVYLKDGKIPVNHRDVLGASALWEKWHQSKSWIANDYKAQKDVYLGIEKMPMDFTDFQKLVGNSIVTTFDGKSAEVTAFKYRFPLNYLDLSYETPNVYTKNLKEESIVL